MTTDKIPAYIIAGFKGSGKTSLLLNLITQRPDGEVWLIVQNEIGEARYPDQENVYIENIPEGCLCCTSKLSLQVNLVKALRTRSYDRIFVESSGLGHITQTKDLLNEYFQNILSIRRLVSIIDAKTLHDERYQNLDLYIEQITKCDLLVINKTDLSSKVSFKNFVKSIYTTNGEIELNTII
jgi:G3E family GTPase